MTTFYLDPANGNDAADGSTFALGGLPTVGPWKTIASGATAARIAPGDIIRIAKSPDPTSLGQTALWTNLSRDVVLQTGAVTAEIDNFESADANWTESTNCTDDDNTTQYKLGANSYRLQVGAAFTTGKASYRDFGAGNEKNLSGYQQISFWFRNSVALANAGDVKIKLCSDSAGATPVNTFSLPAIPSINQWIPITLDNGSALGSSIRSVAIYVDTDFGAVDLYFDNLIACKAPSAADSLTLQSLISKNSAAQGGTEHWYAIQSINGTTIKIDNHTNCLGNAGRGYTGATETVTTYKRETFKGIMCVQATSTPSDMEIKDSGTIGNLLEFQGGYDTGANTQIGETLFDGLNGFGYGITVNSKNYLKINWLGEVRYSQGFSVLNNPSGVVLTNIRCGHNTSQGFNANDYRQTSMQVGNLWLNNNGADGGILGGPGLIAISGSTIITSGNLAAGLLINRPLIKQQTVVSKNNGTMGIIYYATGGTGSNTVIQTLTTADNTTASLQMQSGDNNYIANLNYSETTLLSTNDPWDSPVRLIVGNVNGTPTDFRTLTARGVIYSETSVRHTASGYAWKLSPTNTNLSTSIPLLFKVAEIAVNANSQVTVSAWMRRTNTSVTGSLVCRGGQIAGVDSDVAASITVGADTWEQVTITFTPTAAGVVEIEVWAYGGTTYSVYVDDLSISQA